jgi:hypothetical protein
MSHSKKCVVCGETKEVNRNNFFPSKYHDPDGFSSTCAACNVKQSIEREKALSAAKPLYDPESGRQQAKAATKKEGERKREVDKLLASGMKQCSCCKEIKSLQCFAIDNKAYTGYRSQCRDCSAGALKAKRLSAKEGT